MLHYPSLSYGCVRPELTSRDPTGVANTGVRNGRQLRREREKRKEEEKKEWETKEGEENLPVPGSGFPFLVLRTRTAVVGVGDPVVIWCPGRGRGLGRRGPGYSAFSCGDRAWSWLGVSECNKKNKNKV